MSKKDDHSIDGATDPAEPSASSGRWGLPMLKRYPIIAGAVVGLVLRLVFFDSPGSSLSAMAASFIYVAPVAVGMITVYLAERQRRRTWGYYFMAPALATLLFIAGTLALLVEGLICAIIIVPMFVLLGGVGGLLMGLICRLTKWPKHTLHSGAAVPLLLLCLAPMIPAPDEIGSIERSVEIAAPAELVWQNLHSTTDITAQEMAPAMARHIGVPMPISGQTVTRGNERVRHSRWGKQVHFDEVMQDWRPPNYVRWSYRFADDSFPAGALDDHVRIGGHYFDLMDTSYTLKPTEDGKHTRLTTLVRYRISTQFNFYADWAAQLLIGNLAETGLALYRDRSEAMVAAAADTGAER